MTLIEIKRKLKCYEIFQFLEAMMTIDKEDQDDDEVTFKLRWLRFCSATTLTLDLLMNQFQ